MVEAALERKRREISRSEAQALRHRANRKGFLENIVRVEDQIRKREERITNYETSVTFYERRSRDLQVDVIQRHIARRVVRDLKRSIGSLRGWQTRGRREIAGLRRRAALAFYYEHYYRVRRSFWVMDLWLETLRDSIKPVVRKREQEGTIDSDFIAVTEAELKEIEEDIPFLLGDLVDVRRVAVERDWSIRWPRDYRTMERWISAIYGQLRSVRFWIAEIRIELVVLQIVQADIIIYAIVESPGERLKREYTKRFQAFYKLDALRPRTTGEIDFTYELTRTELDACTYDFYERFKWIKHGVITLPKYTSAPEWAETGNFEYLEQPEGAFIVMISVLEVDPDSGITSEIYRHEFKPPLRIYTLTRTEIENMLSHIGKTEEQIEEILS